MGNKKVLVVGSGGREHALCWKFAQSPQVSHVYCTPGNAGISKHATCIPIKATDIEALAKFAKENKIDLTVVGPEAPLALGIVDFFEDKGLRIFGPKKAAAQIEASKVFMKDLLAKYNIPTAPYKVFSDPEEAFNYVKNETGVPIVIKADGLAAGKGVIVAHSLDEAKKAIDLMLVEKKFGDAGSRIIIEECLMGEEASFMAITDGKTCLALASSQDHKPVFDDDRGPNTGGMGAYSPAPVITDELYNKIQDTIMTPVVDALLKEGRPYMGVLYGGLMIKDGEPMVLEFNCRFGDPEAQPILMRMKSDLYKVIESALDGNLDLISIDWDPRPSVCVVLASKGYPGSYEKGKVIYGLDEVEKMKDVVVFHAGTAKQGEKFVTAGGRVLGVTALGDSIEAAIERAYEAVSKISWEGMHYRTDIGAKALKHLGENGSLGPKVGILIGSKSDLEVMNEAKKILDDFGIPNELKIASAHRTPDIVMDYAQRAKERGIKVIICGAGMAAHLAGCVAAQTLLPVIGVPMAGSTLGGIDALLSTVQMPAGIPVATMAIGKAGAKNAAIMAARIIALSDKKVLNALEKYRDSMRDAVLKQ